MSNRSPSADVWDAVYASVEYMIKQRVGWSESWDDEGRGEAVVQILDSLNYDVCSTATEVTAI